MAAVVDLNGADCNTDIDLNDDDEFARAGTEQQVPSATINQFNPTLEGDTPVSTNGNAPSNINDDEDDFFSELGGAKSSKPNPSTLVTNTQPYKNETNVPQNQTNYSGLDGISEELKSANLLHGDDEPQNINITVTDPRKIGDNFIDSYITFRVRTVITPNTEVAGFFNNNKECIVDRRFSDFLGLHEKLKAKHQHKGLLVPAPPEKDVKALAKIRVSNNEQEAVELNAISRRRAALERFLNRLAAHPVMIKDELFQSFLMNPTLQSSKSLTSAFSINGMKKMFKTAEDQVTKLTKPYIEQDAWFDEKTASVDRVHNQYTQLFAICTQLYRNRRELGESFSGLSSELAGLVQLEQGHDKSGYMTDLCKKLGGTYTSVQQSVHQQQKIDCFDLTEIIGDHMRILESVKELLYVRVKAFQGCQTAEESLYAKQQTKSKFEGEAKFDKIPKLDYEIVEYKKQVERAKENFVTLSNTIKREISVYEIKRAVRMKHSIKAYLEQLAAHHLKMADIWKDYLNQAKKL